MGGVVKKDLLQLLPNECGKQTLTEFFKLNQEKTCDVFSRLKEL